MGRSRRRDFPIPEELMAGAKVLGVNMQMLAPPPRSSSRPRPSAISSFEPNGLEADYARYLDKLYADGQVARYDFQALKLVIGRVEKVAAGKVTVKTTYYIPDFVVYLPDGAMELHETKGYMEEDAYLKVKTCAMLYPFPIRLVRKAKNGGFDVETFRG